MRHTTILLGTLLAVLIVSRASAQPQQKLKIEEAVVFLKGAELTSSARVNLAAGENEILFTNVAGNINTQSITVGASGGVVVEAATFQSNYLTNNIITARAKEIKDSIEILEAGKNPVNDRLLVIEGQISLLTENKNVGGDNNGLSVAELTKLLDLYSARYEGYLNQKGRLEEVLRKTDERIDKLNQQMNEEQTKTVQPGGQILVKFYAKQATASLITIDYVVTNAGWSPAYDIMADKVNMPIKLAYKANIYQNTGINWNNVKLTLNTGNPNEGVNAPALNPLYLAFYVPPQTYNQDNSNALREVVVVRQYKKALVNSDNASASLVLNKENQATISDYVSVDNAGVNTNFEIDLPYTISCDGKQHLVAVKKYELPATYRYFAVPKLDKDAFLQAQVTQWEDLNLLPGTTNIFYEGTYVGQGNLDVRNLKDTFTISLGRDKKIVVKRDRDTQRRSVKTIGTNVREEFSYSISIRNNRKENINLIIQDQMPVSNDKDIELEALDNGGSAIEENTGIMNWDIQLKPNETKKMEFGFTVKYPKGKTVLNLK